MEGWLGGLEGYRAGGLEGWRVGEGGLEGWRCFAFFCGKDRFDRFGTWSSNQRYKWFGLRYTAVWDKSIVETAIFKARRKTSACHVEVLKMANPTSTRHR